MQPICAVTFLQSSQSSAFDMFCFLIFTFFILFSSTAIFARAWQPGVRVKVGYPTRLTFVPPAGFLASARCRFSFPTSPASGWLVTGSSLPPAPMIAGLGISPQSRDSLYFFIVYLFTVLPPYT